MPVLECGNTFPVKLLAGCRNTALRNWDLQIAREPLARSGEQLHRQQTRNREERTQLAQVHHFLAATTMPKLRVRLDYSKYPMLISLSSIPPFSIKAAMTRLLWSMI